jgi:hypothetical protein
MVFSRMILRFVVSKEGKLLDPKKIQSHISYACTHKSTTDSGIQQNGSIL